MGPYFSHRMYASRRLATGSRCCTLDLGSENRSRLPGGVAEEGEANEDVEMAGTVGCDPYVVNMLMGVWNCQAER